MLKLVQEHPQDAAIAEWQDLQPSKAFSGLESVNLSDWNSIQTCFPRQSQLILAEYRRVKGFIPYELGYVYAIQAVGTDYVKFGKTGSPDRRILQISPKMPFETKYLRVWPSNFMSIAEKWLHGHFSVYRKNGEWFSLNECQRYQLFDDFDYAYREQIRHAYASSFFERIGFDKLVTEWLYCKHGQLGGWWAGSPFSMAVVESIFEGISREEKWL